METLGEYLASVRRHLNLTLEEVSHQTEIFEKFISYIEEGKYQLLPPDVYVIGFLKKLAELYKISYEDLLVQFKKERGIVEHNAREKMIVKKSFKERMKEVSITPKLLTISGSALLALIVFGYIALQVFSVNRTPSLVITEPQSGVVLNGNSVTVKGTTESGMTVQVNGQNIYVKPDGSFEATLSIAPGQKDLRIVSSNKFGKQREQIVSLRAEDPQVAGAVTTEAPSELILELEFTKQATIIVERDGIELPEETIPAKATKKIIAEESVVVTTSDAGNTIATLNGEDLGPLGKRGEKLTVPFTQEATELMNLQNSDQDSADQVSE